MQLVNRYKNLEGARHDSELLRSKGIATFISSKKSHQLGGYFTGAFAVGLWVVFVQQADDARALLENHDHRVANPLSEEQIAELDDYGMEEARQMLFNGLMKLVTTLLVLLLLGLASYRIWLFQ